jgi:HCOMODA/2-hydroxy-3-carboxy-muconic semialdehyde decarboxylase
MAARALARAGLVHAFGHCSVRLSRAEFLVCAAEPMGLLAADDEGLVVPIERPLPDGALGEVRIHQAIYRRRPEIGGVCRVLPPSVMALSALGATPRALTGYGAFFAPSVPLYDDARLVRDDAAADAAARTLGQAAAIVLRGNGAVTVADTLPHAVGLAWYLEQSARIELQVRACGDAVHGLTPAEAHTRARWDGRIDERLWSYLTHGDPEAGDQ